MEIKQWEDKNLSHYSYAVLDKTEKKIAIIDPSRNPGIYLEFAKKNDAAITAIIETHPHADFVSSHLELHALTGAPVYAHSMVGAAYAHQPFDDGASIQLGNLTLRSLHTPGHSPDSISIVLENDGKQEAVFTGDTLFIGDCGRPDLREGAGNIHAARKDLAKQMYHSLREKIMKLDDHVLVYPAHGAGTLCGKNLSKDNSSTIGKEKQTNWSLQEATEEEFVKNLLTDQPFVPAYFPFDVEMNRMGAPVFSKSISNVVKNNGVGRSLDNTHWIIDARNEKNFKRAHLKNAINLMEKGKFETWLGSIIRPREQFYLTGESKEQIDRLIERAAAIGYEAQIKEAFVQDGGDQKDPVLDIAEFKKKPDDFTIVDIRNMTEINKGKIFANSLSIPLPELRDRLLEIPVDKPIVVHCAGGYRSAAGSSMIQAKIGGIQKIYDLGEAIKEFN